MLLDLLRAHVGQLTITLTASGEDLPKIPDALTATVGSLMRMAEDWIVAQEALDRTQRLDLLGRLPDPEDLVARIPPRHGVWMSVSVDADPLIVPLSPGVRATKRVVVDHRVALLRPLLEHEQQPRELLVLTLSEQQADLLVLDLISRTLEPVGDPFPIASPGDQATTQDRSDTWQLREQRRHHWRRVAQAAHRAFEVRDLPMVTVGVERNQSFLREVSAWADELTIAVAAAPDHLREPDLIGQILNAAEEHQQRRIDQIRSLIDARRGRDQVATGLTNVFSAAVAGRIDTLVLVDGPPVEGYRTPGGRLLAVNPGDGEHVPDVYALGMAEVVRRGGRVLLAPEGTLAASTAILRW